MSNILLLEDDLSLIDGLQYTLEASGYMVDNAKTVKEALALFRKNTYDLLLLDVTLPDGTGFDVCKAVRNSSTVPIIFLTASDQEISIVRGLDMGADDYLTKPFSVLELISRVRAILRRCTVEEKPETVELGGIVLDDSKHIVTSNGEQCSLTYKEYELLKYLLNNKGMALTRENIIINVWGYDFEGESRTVDMHITTLRQKLGECGNLIKTVRNVGYKAGE